MADRERDELERNIRRLVEAADLDAATTVALEGYGPEILRFLIGFHGDEAAASEVFSLFAEGIWRGIRTFDWACLFRTWAFAVARMASLRHRRDQGRRAAREAPLAQCAAISEIAEQVRSQTLSYLRTERRSRFAAIRDNLPPDDRALLMLRIDRKLAWKDCARVMHAEMALGDDALDREAARLRKRFQLLKEKLLAIGRSEGLVSDRSDR